MTQITNIDENELRELLIKNLPNQIKGGTEKENSNIKSFPTSHALKECKFINFNTKERISFMVFDIDSYEDKSALDYFKNINNFLEYIVQIIGLEPTFITQTKKGFHFAYHLKNHIFTHQKNALEYLKTIKESITQKTNSDLSASHRLNGVWRNPLKHTHYYSHQINYELNDFKNLLPKQRKKYDSKKSTSKLFIQKDLEVGERNRGLFYNGMRYAKFEESVTVENIYQFLQSINLELDEPLEEDEVLKISESVFKYKINNKIDDKFGKVDSQKKDINNGIMEFEKMSNLSYEEYQQETKRRQSLAAKRTCEVRDQSKNKEQLKKVREQYINKKYLENEIKIRDAINYYITNNEKINVSKIAKLCNLDRRTVKKFHFDIFL